MLKNLRNIPPKKLTLNTTATWACTMSRPNHGGEAETYHEAPIRDQLPVSAEARARRDQNIP